MSFSDFYNTLEKNNSVVKKVRKQEKLFNDEEYVYKLEDTRFKSMYQQIHKNLAKKSSVTKINSAELEIREIVKIISVYDLPIAKAKVEKFEHYTLTTKKKYEKEKSADTKQELLKQTSLFYEWFKKWSLLYEEFYALIAFRSLEHFAIFMEWDKPLEDKMWEHSIDTFKDNGWSGCTKGFFYYANKMVLTDDINFIEKQLPTNYGKCVHKNTLVRTPNGIKKICELKVGDFVYSMKNNEIVERKILNIWNTHKKQVKITTNSGAEIIVSKEHKLFTQKGYLQAQEITENDYLYRLCGNIEKYNFVFEKISKIEYLDDYADMVDIEVDETHNFIANDIVSHNSYSDSMMIAFIFGIDKDEQVVKVVGNRSLPSKCTTQVVNIMASKRYLQVFPEYAELYDGDGEIKDSIFEICRVADGLLTIKGSSKDTNYECFSKETRRDGIRCGYLFLDDIVQAREILNLNQHEEDKKTFDASWKKRCRDEYHFKIVLGGTTYDAYDLLCELKNRYSGGKIIQSKINKWTFTNKQGNSVFICVPKLDDKDNLTFPQKCKLENVLADRRNNYEVFMAMDMQKPMVPKEYSFYWDYLKQYDYIPSDCTEFAQATLDPARTGKNYVSMPICRYRKELDEFGKETEIHYLVDALYKKITMDEAYSRIIVLIEKYHIVKLHIERNTDTSLKYLLDKMLSEHGIDFCEVSEVYSVKNKEERIYADENLIKKRIRYPQRDMYSIDSDIGKFMNHIISYKYKGSEYDDSIDSIGLYCDKFINKPQDFGTATLLYI